MSLRYSSKLEVPLVSIACRGLRNEFPPNSKCLKMSVILINTKRDLLITMDYSPWSERENWPFLKVAVSSKPEKVHPPKLVCMHVTSMHTCMNFLSQF